MRTVFCFFLLFFLHVQCIAQDLPRRAYMGAQLNVVSTERKKAANYPHDEGVFIQAVGGNGIAQSAGLMSGDIIISMNDKKVATPSELINLLKSYTGTSITLQYWRQNKELNAAVKVIRFPDESIENARIEYGNVDMNGYKLRTITTIPGSSNAKRPVLFYIQGLGCSSVDFGMDTANPQFKIIKQFSQAGFITFRIEKSGMGDSEGTPCSQIDFDTELEGYKKGLAAIRKHPLVDPAQVFVFGHSMGGVMAPFVAENENIKGIIVYGTITKPLAEYFIESRRIQTAPMELPQEQAEEFMRAWSKCAPLYLYGNETPEQLAARYPECAMVIQTFALRALPFWRQFASRNLAAAWLKYKGQVLALWGERDVVADRSDHEILSNLLNRANKGHAVFRVVPNSTHQLTYATSHQTTFYNNSVYNAGAGKMTLDWINSLKEGTFTSYSDFSDSRVKKVLQEDGVELAYPRWLGKSENILFQSNRTGKWQLYRIHKSGKDLKRITNDDYNNNFVDVSPDGSKVAFVSDRDGNEEIYVMNTDGSQLTRLTNDAARDIHPYFSPDGKKILFNSTRNNPDENFDIYEISADGTGLKRITETPDTETCARYSPDMKTILYLKGDQSLRNDEVFIMSVETRQFRNVTNSMAAEGWPCWTKDGKSIIYSSDETGTFNLYQVGIDGKNRKKITAAAYPYRDARASVHPITGDIVLNRQETGTIGIYVLKN